MNRRGFLGGLAALVAGVAIEQAIPLGRVWSFPSKIVIPGLLETPPSGVFGISHLATVYYDRKALDALRANFRFMEYVEPTYLPAKRGKTIQFYRA